MIWILRYLVNAYKCILCRQKSSTKTSEKNRWKEGHAKNMASLTIYVPLFTKMTLRTRSREKHPRVISQRYSRFLFWSLPHALLATKIKGCKKCNLFFSFLFFPRLPNCSTIVCNFNSIFSFGRIDDWGNYHWLMKKYS